jgi:hypothetical protein
MTPEATAINPSSPKFPPQVITMAMEEYANRMGLTAQCAHPVYRLLDNDKVVLEAHPGSDVFELTVHASPEYGENSVLHLIGLEETLLRYGTNEMRENRFPVQSTIPNRDTLSFAYKVCDFGPRTAAKDDDLVIVFTDGAHVGGFLRGRPGN